jgi:ABC-type lipoprotein export system ATPase subunit
MLREIADGETTVVIATHDPAALGYVDEAYFIQSGRLHRPRRDELNLWLTEGIAFGEIH